MKGLKEYGFQLSVTKIHRRSVDRLIELADSFREINHKKLISSMETENGEIDYDAFESVYIESPQIAFSLYALAIVHCYSLVEKNRKLICLRIPELTEGQKENLYDLRVVTQCLLKVGFKHENVKCFKTMDEFRLVNNAVKHDRYGRSKFVTTEKQKKNTESNN